MFGNIPPLGWLILAVLVLVLFGRGRVSGLMGEMGKGITSFKKGLQEGKDELEAEKAANAEDVTPIEEKESSKS